MSTARIADTDGTTDPMVPRLARIARRRRDGPQVWTLEIEAEDSAGAAFAPGQFNMLTAFGVGEVPISLSGDPAEPDRLVHTIRAVGPVSTALARLGPGETVGLRGPFGVGWPMAELAGHDVLIVAGGLGLAPLRPVLYRLLAERARYGKVVLLYGTRSPQEILFRREIESWRRRLDIDIEVTVDHALGDWHGHVGVVTTLIPRASFDPAHTVAGLRPGSDDALRRRSAPRRRLAGHSAFSFHGTEHEMRRRPLRPLPNRPRLCLPRWAGFSLRPPAQRSGGEGDLTCRARTPSPGLQSGSLPRATAVSLACWIVRMSCSQWPKRWRSLISRKRCAVLSAAATTFLWWKDRSPRRTMPSASARCAAARAIWSRSGLVRRQAASRRCGILPTLQSTRPSFMRARTIFARWPHQRRSPIMCPSILNSAAARSTSASSWK